VAIGLSGCFEDLRFLGAVIGPHLRDRGQAVCRYPD